MEFSNSKFNEMNFDEMQEVDGGFNLLAAGCLAVITLGTLVALRGCSDADHGK